MGGEEYPAIIQPDGRILVRENCSGTQQASVASSRIGRLIKTPGYFRTYRLDQVSIWNSMAMGCSAEQILSDLEKVCRNTINDALRKNVLDTASRYGKLILEKQQDLLNLHIKDPSLRNLVQSELEDLLDGRTGKDYLGINPYHRGNAKVRMINAGYPIQDLAGFTQGDKLEINLKQITTSGRKFELWPEQKEDVDLFLQSQGINGGSFVIEEPCGMGKTIIALAIMCKLQMQTLILVPKPEDIDDPWRRELLDKTDIDPSMIGEFSADKKQVKPITIATYRSASYRDRTGEYKNLGLFDEMNYGLVIYDEVHGMPAEISQITAQIQAKIRLGLSGSLVREDNKLENIFALIGASLVKRPWKDAENKGRIAKGYCNEIKVQIHPSLEEKLSDTDGRSSNKIIAANPQKNVEMMKILNYHSKENDRRIIIGFHVEPLRLIADLLGLPLIYGPTPRPIRQILYKMLNKGELDTLVVSSVGNETVNIPPANVMIGINGHGGSQKEEAQRFGRILRFIEDKISHLYLLTTEGTREEEFSENRKRFLIDQGYRYCTAQSFEEILRLRGMPPLNGQKQRKRSTKEEITRIVERELESIKDKVRRRTTRSAKKTYKKRARKPKFIDEEEFDDESDIFDEDSDLEQDLDPEIFEEFNERDDFMQDYERYLKGW